MLDDLNNIEKNNLKYCRPSPNSSIFPLNRTDNNFDKYVQEMFDICMYLQIVLHYLYRLLLESLILQEIKIYL